VHLGCLIGPAGFSKLVAIKSLHREFASEPEFVSMFLDEARLASSIHHPNVVPALDVVVEEEELLVVMDYVHGETLAGLQKLAKRQKLAVPVPIAVSVCCDALEGLHAAHTASRAGQSLNIVHRDVSPQNIMVGADGNARILDFGIAKAALRSRVTAAGTVKGKVAYMAPEQIRGQEVDARTDVFAAGVVLWESLTGQRLFWAPDSRTAIHRVLKAPVAPPSAWNQGLTSALDQVVLKALARDPGQRFQTAQAFADALRRASPEGSRGEIAKWVARVADEVLARRLELLHTIESSAMLRLSQAQGAEYGARGGEPGARADVENDTHAGAAGRAVIELPVIPSLDSTHTRAATTTSVQPRPPATRRQRLVRWGAAALSVAGVSALLLASRSPRATVPPFRPASAAAALAPELPPPVSPLPSALPPLEEQSSAPPSHVEVNASTSPPPDVAPSAETKPGPAPPSKAPHRTAPTRPTEAAEPKTVAAPAPPSCNPPYRVDAAGVRRVKPECL